MKIGGIIVEYNPFHNGHKYQIEEYKKLYGITHLVVAMSGNFIQRGGPSVIDKYSRAEIALKNGADLVLEIPTYMSTQTAEIYAKGGIMTLNSLGCIDSICFGSESGDIDLLKESAKIILGEKGNYEESIRKYLNSGDSFPIAREKSIIDNLKVGNYKIPEDVEFLKKSNNILGIEYIKEIILSGSKIKPETIRRHKSVYNSEKIEGEITSATSIRNLILKGENIHNYVPESSNDIISISIKNNIRMLNDESFFGEILDVIIRDEDIYRYFDIDEGIKNLILNNIFSSLSIEDFLNKSSNKTYTKSRLRRCLYNILLNIKKSDMELIKDIKFLPYCRVLGFNRKGTEILKKIKISQSEKIEEGIFEIIIQPAKSKKNKVYEENPNFRKILDFDLKCSNIYYQKSLFDNRILLSKGEIDYVTLKKLL